MSDFATEFVVTNRFELEARQWLFDERIYHQSEPIWIQGGDETRARNYRVRFARPQDALAFQQRYYEIFAAWG
jgi:hypothetical protein